MGRAVRADQCVVGVRVDWCVGEAGKRDDSLPEVVELDDSMDHKR